MIIISAWATVFSVFRESREKHWPSLLTSVSSQAAPCPVQACPAAPNLPDLDATLWQFNWAVSIKISIWITVFRLISLKSKWRLTQVTIWNELHWFERMAGLSAAQQLLWRACSSGPDDQELTGQPLTWSFVDSLWLDDITEIPSSCCEIRLEKLGQPHFDVFKRWQTSDGKCLLSDKIWYLWPLPTARSSAEDVYLVFLAILKHAHAQHGNQLIPELQLKDLLSSCDVPEHLLRQDLRDHCQKMAILRSNNTWKHALDTRWTGPEWWLEAALQHPGHLCCMLRCCMLRWQSTIRALRLDARHAPEKEWTGGRRKKTPVSAG